MKKKNKSKGKLYFRILKKLMKGRYKKPNFVFLGEEFDNGALILSNHEGTDSPMSLEIYLDKPIRMWGAAEMNSGLKQLYKYQTNVYYHEKLHWNIHLARLFCLVASPLTWLFYSGFNLISTYRDARFMITLKESIKSIEDGDNIVIFPEDSSKGYLEELEGFHNGYILLLEQCEKRNMDVPIYVSYFRKSDRAYIFDKPYKYSELKDKFKTREEISDFLCSRCNELRKVKIENKVKGQ